jgi:hypothetical protein
LQKIINEEISRRGADYPLDRDTRVTARIKRLEEKIDDLEDDNPLDAAELDLEDASRDLDTEMRRYFKRLPQTAKNLRLEKNIREARSANNDEMLALANSEEKKFDTWAEQAYKRAGGEPKTLGDARHAFAVVLQAIDQTYALYDPGVKRFFALARNDQAIIERIWDADQ